MIEWYISTQEPLTRAGAFGISRIGEIFVDALEGEYSCVAGLPKRATLLALSDPALGESRLGIPEHVRQMLRSDEGHLIVSRQEIAGTVHGRRH